MRFRLRDILLLMVLVAVYLTTLIKVVRSCSPEGLQSYIYVGVLVQVPVFLVVFPGQMLVIHHVAVRKVRPVLLKLDSPIAWKSYFVLLGFTVLVGCIAIVIGSPAGLAAFFGASMLFLGNLILLLFLNDAKLGKTGVVYFNGFQPWSNIEVERSAEGVVEAIYPFPTPPIARKFPLLRLVIPRPRIEVPLQEQQQVTELHEQSIQKP